MLKNLQQEVHNALLAQSDPREHLKALGASNPTSAINEALKNATLVQRNAYIFAMHGMAESEPYRVLIDCMKTATKHLPEVGGGYREVPDWGARRAAANNILTLMGRDPKYEIRMQVGANGRGGVTVGFSFGDMLIEIQTADTQEQKLDVYNQLKRGMKSGEISPEFDAVIEGEFKEATDETIQSQYDKLPEEKF